MAHAGGRPTDYKPEFCKAILDYFSVDKTKVILEKFYYKNGDEKEKEIEVANELPTLQGFSRSIGVWKTTMLDWTKKHKEFYDAYCEAKDLQEDFWLTNSLKGLYPAQFAIFAGKNMFNWKDKTEQEIKITDISSLLSKEEDN